MLVAPSIPKKIKPFVVSGKLFTPLNLSNDAKREHVYFENGYMAVGTEGRIEFVGSVLPTCYSNYEFRQTKHLILPGFVDAHVHYPQLPVIASFGKTLLDWLNTYTFPEEIKYAERKYAEERAHQFFRQILSKGVTSAVVFSTTHIEAFEALLNKRQEFGVNLVSGVTAMDRGAPPDLTIDLEKFKDINQQAIEYSKYFDRVKYAITPRFALSCSDQLLDYCGQILEADSSLLMQTHVNETRDEVIAASELFPNAKDYLDIYDSFGLLRDRSIFAHGIYTTDSELDRWASSGASVVHCPTSNTFLGSGLFERDKYLASDINVSLGSDVGGGYSFNPFVTMAEAYKIAQLKGSIADPIELIYSHTLAGAYAMHQEDFVGSLEVGKWADFCLIDISKDDRSIEIWEKRETIRDRLFALMFTLPESSINVQETYVGGIRRWKDNIETKFNH